MVQKKRSKTFKKYKSRAEPSKVSNIKFSLNQLKTSSLTAKINTKYSLTKSLIQYFQTRKLVWLLEKCPLKLNIQQKPKTWETANNIRSAKSVNLKLLSETRIHQSKEMERLLSLMFSEWQTTPVFMRVKMNKHPTVDIVKGRKVQLGKSSDMLRIHASSPNESKISIAIFTQSLKQKF